MSNNATAPTVTSYTFMNILDTIKEVYGVKDARQSAYQLDYVVKSLFETAVYFAVKDAFNTNGNSNADSFEVELTTKGKACQGIANHYGVEFKPSLDYTEKNFKDSNLKTLDNMKKVFITSFPREYGLTEVATWKTAQTAINKLSFRLTPADEVLANVETEKRIAKYVADNQETLIELYEDANNDEDLINAVREAGTVEPVEAIAMTKKLTQDAQEAVDNANTIVNDVWNKVKKLADVRYPNAEFEDVHDIDETQLYYMVGKLIQLYDSSHSTMETKAFQATKAGKTKLATFFVEQQGSALTIVSLCNEIKAKADQVYNSNTTNETDSEGDTNPNLAGQKDHDRDVQQNVNH